jgi:hypothetical protein
MAAMFPCLHLMMAVTSLSHHPRVMDQNQDGHL